MLIVAYWFEEPFRDCPPMELFLFSTDTDDSWGLLIRVGSSEPLSGDDDTWFESALKF